ncbi:MULTISPECIES: integrase domain-containing protein [unclassified Pantoea]|uniref:integrase domain-containing protein n=1 Tax=unclassified Pantoea TaxID=2630326 RepID=UPI001CD7181B|nr:MULTISPECIES: integrase domain-containing protein [unclassified Pantoea]MCA1179570.1 integrase domain-containing protein [Pantoea sp. alder69]MCA1251823.1 integrase domain-containing protein [Pantoea sp. alder70]MCA1267840.1 integrase domain-containing protein [Pantoea sp. alder81]
MAGKLSKQLVTLARQGGGSFKTVSDRSKIASRFSDRLATLNIQIREVSHIKTKHIENYIRSRQDENISSRTLQNEMAALRSILSQGGRNVLANPAHEKLSNQALNISGASREGTKVAISDERLKEIISTVSEKDRGIALGIHLARYIGLRAEETVQSAKSLNTWRKNLLAGENTVRVVFGSKGGRPRDATIFERDKVIALLNEAIRYVDDNNGKLVDKPTLHQALDRYHNVLRESGMTGIHAPHSLRYAYSQDAVNHHLENGMSRKEAEALVSMDLGHGDGRGDYVARVYNRVDETG